MKAAVVAKDEFIEVNVDVFAPQAVIRAQRPALHQRKSPMAPWQDDIGRHIADDARLQNLRNRDATLAALHPTTDAQTQALAAAKATVESIGQSRMAGRRPIGTSSNA